MSDDEADPAHGGAVGGIGGSGGVESFLHRWVSKGRKIVVLRELGFKYVGLI